MTADLLALARRAVAAHAWRWKAMLGAVVRTPDGLGRVVDVLPPSEDDPDDAIYLAVIPAVDAAGDLVEDVPVDRSTWYVLPGGEAWDPMEPDDPDRRGEVLPDLTDPATLGCLLALVRAAWGDPEAWVQPPGQPGARWCAVAQSAGVPDGRLFDGASEAEALVTALEAAS